jgi:hypothetical protein
VRRLRPVLDHDRFLRVGRTGVRDLGRGGDGSRLDGCGLRGHRSDGRGLRLGLRRRRRLRLLLLRDDHLRLGGFFRELADHDLRAPDDVPAELMPALQLFDDEAVVVGVGHRTAPDELGRTSIERQPEHRDALEAFLLEDAEELGAHHHHAGDERLQRVAVPGGLDRAVHGFEGLHGGEQEALAALLVFLGELGFEPVAEGLVVGLERARRGRHFRDAVLGEARRLAERLEGVRRGRRSRWLALLGGGGGRGLSVRLLGTPRVVGQAASGGSRAVYRRVTGLRR